MVMVLAPCRRDMVTDLSYRMVKVIAPCRRDMVPDLKSKMVVVVALPAAYFSKIPRYCCGE